MRSIVVSSGSSPQLSSEVGAVPVLRDSEISLMLVSKTEESSASDTSVGMVDSTAGFSSGSLT